MTDIDRLVPKLTPEEGIETRSLRNVPVAELVAEIEALRAELSIKYKYDKSEQRRISLPNYLTRQGFFPEFIDRGLWLISLLLVQSCSTLILARNEELIKKHPSVVFFLTMLIGAGGNCGNQAAVIMVRMLALQDTTGEVERSASRLLQREVLMAFGLTVFIGSAGLVRVALSPHTDFSESAAITTSLCCIIFLSVILGALLPIGLYKLGLDPAHATTSIQVSMDIIGVLLTCGITHSMMQYLEQL